MESPEDKTADIGPMSSKNQYDKVRQYILLGIEEGARMLYGRVPEEEKEDYCIEPVVFTDV